MTFREKLQQEHPEKVDDIYIGGCRDCPKMYGYEEGDDREACDEYNLILEECGDDVSEYVLDALCRKCWDREMPKTEDGEWEQVAGNSEIIMTKDGDIRFRCSGPTISNEEPAGDPVNAPSHYNAGGFECWDVMEAVFGKEALYYFSVCNAYKYLFRAGKKDDLLQDLRKAIVYLEKAIEVKEKSND